MSSETPTETSSLEEARDEIHKASQLAIGAREEFWKKLQMTAVLVQSYNQRRRELFQKELESRQVTWCGRCDKLAPLAEVRLLHHTGKRRVRSGDDGYSDEPFSVIYRACASCQAALLSEHGRFDTQIQGSKFVYPVEQRGDEYYSQGKKIEESGLYDSGRFKMNHMSDTLFSQLCKEWEISPELVLDAEGKVSTK